MSSAESEKQGVGLPPLLDPQSPGMINRAGDRHSGLGRQRLRKLPGFREASSLLLPQTPLRWMWESSCGVWSQEWGGAWEREKANWPPGPGGMQGPSH